MTFLEGLLLLPLLAILIAAMVAYASVSGNLRTTEAEEREEKKAPPNLGPKKVTSDGLLHFIAKRPITS